MWLLNVNWLESMKIQTTASVTLATSQVLKNLVLLVAIALVGAGADVFIRAESTMDGAVLEV